MATIYFDRDIVFPIYEYPAMGVLRTEYDGATISAGDASEIVLVTLWDTLGVEEVLPVRHTETDFLSIVDDCAPYAWGGLKTKHISDERYKGRRTYPKTTQ